MKALLEIKDLHIIVDEKEIIKGFDLKMNPGEMHVVIGPNGAGKSTLAKALLGHPKLTTTKGKIIFTGEDISTAKPEDRAKLGLFVS